MTGSGSRAKSAATPVGEPESEKASGTGPQSSSSPRRQSVTAQKATCLESPHARAAHPRSTSGTTPPLRPLRRGSPRDTELEHRLASDQRQMETRPHVQILHRGPRTRPALIEPASQAAPVRSVGLAPADKGLGEAPTKVRPPQKNPWRVIPSRGTSRWAGGCLDLPPGIPLSVTKHRSPYGADVDSE